MHGQTSIKDIKRGIAFWSDPYEQLVQKNDRPQSNGSKPVNDIICRAHFQSEIQRSLRTRRVIDETVRVSAIDKNVRAVVALNKVSHFVNHFEGLPRIDAVKGTWQGDHAFVIDWLVLGLGRSPERWTLTFFGEKVTVLVNFPEGGQILIDGETGG